MIKTLFSLPISTDIAQNLSPQELVNQIEDSINAQILYSYNRYIEKHDETSASFPGLAKILDHYINFKVWNGINSWNPDFTYNFKEGQIFIKSKNKEILLKIDFVTSEKLVPLNQTFVSNWTYGRIPLVVGKLQEGRSVAKQMSQVLGCSMHFINGNEGLAMKVIENVLEAVLKESVLMVLENVDQLGEEVQKFLVEKMEKMEEKSLLR